MKRICTILTAAVFSVLLFSFAVRGDVMIDTYIPQRADYDIVVSAPDGGVNLRYGPGTEYGKILPDMIPNGVVLHVMQEAEAGNGNLWGNVNYSGYYGWVALTQCTVITNTGSSEPSSPAPAYKTANHVDYTIQVSAPDGGVNLRKGAGTEYEKLIDHMIPNGVLLHVFFEDVAANGNSWGFVKYDSVWGWVALTQCSRVSAGTGTVDRTPDYSVKASSPDGGINLRGGPGVEYSPLLSHMIQNGTVLEIREEAVAGNGRYWGKTTYEGIDGYVTLVEIEPVAGKKAASTTARKPEEGSRTSSAAEADIEFSRSIENGQEKGYVFCYNSKGKLKWIYETGKYESTELFRVTDIGRFQDRYYICEGGTIVALSVETGKPLWKNGEFAGSNADGAAVFDKKGTLFISGYYGPDLFIVSGSGKTLLRMDSFGDEYIWPYSLTLREDDTIDILFGMNENSLNVDVSAYTGTGSGAVG